MNAISAGVLASAGIVKMVWEQRCNGGGQHLKILVKIKDMACSNNMPFGYELDSNVVYTGRDLDCEGLSIEAGDTVKVIISKMFDKICDLQQEINELKGEGNG